ncbi:hypothetical protein C8R42DRAFT_689231 [Lentinula raphanica]|nr:hypothetical protein C8R42DRAFT_689231 [Lentinula raphanica]
MIIHPRSWNSSAYCIYDMFKVASHCECCMFLLSLLNDVLSRRSSYFTTAESARHSSIFRATPTETFFHRYIFRSHY